MKCKPWKQACTKITIGAITCLANIPLIAKPFASQRSGSSFQLPPSDGSSGDQEATSVPFCARALSVLPSVGSPFQKETRGNSCIACPTYPALLPKLRCHRVRTQKDASFLQTWLYFDEKKLDSRDMFTVGSWTLLWFSQNATWSSFVHFS